MNRVLVTYGDEKYQRAKSKLVNSAKRLKYFDEIYAFSNIDIDAKFWSENEEILSVPRGNGLWLWKPYFIKIVLDSLEYGDILFYCDAGAIFLKTPKYLENCFADIFVSDIPLIERQFTKKYVIDTLQLSDKILNSNQIIATYIIVRKTKKSEEIIRKWLNLCTDKMFIGPTSGKNEYPDFVAHREDQSLLSVVCKANGIDANWDITQRRYLPYTYWNEKYKFMLPNHKDKLGIYLFLHKQQNPTVCSMLYLYFKQLYVNFKFKILERKH